MFTFIVELYKSCGSLLTMSCCYGDRNACLISYCFRDIYRIVHVPQLEHLVLLHLVLVSLGYLAVYASPDQNWSAWGQELVPFNFVFWIFKSQGSYMRLCSLHTTPVCLINMTSQGWKWLLALINKLCALGQDLKKGMSYYFSAR